jgi:hypothetical protein
VDVLAKLPQFALGGIAESHCTTLVEIARRPLDDVACSVSISCGGQRATGKDQGARQSIAAPAEAFKLCCFQRQLGRLSGVSGVQRDGCGSTVGLGLAERQVHFGRTPLGGLCCASGARAAVAPRDASGSAREAPPQLQRLMR